MPGRRNHYKVKRRPIRVLSVHWGTYLKLKAFAAFMGLSMAKTLEWLVDNRPELGFKPLILFPRDPKATDGQRILELEEFISRAEAKIPSEPVVYDQDLTAAKCELASLLFIGSHSS